MEPILTIPEVTRYLKISKAKIYYLVQRNEIPNVKIGRNVRIRESDSSTLERVEGNARLERGDPVAVVTRLKEQPGPDLKAGGVQLASALIQAGLIDEYRIFIQQIILGAGRSIYPALNEAVRLKLVETHTFHTGIVYLRYQR